MTKNAYMGTVTLTMKIRVQADSTEAATAELKQIACQRHGIRPEHIDGAWVTPVLGTESMTAENFRAWQESQALLRGTSSQRSRWAAGSLPETELLDLARNELFRTFSFFMKRTPMGFSDIKHPTSAGGIWTCLNVPRASGPVSDPIQLITWNTRLCPDLTETEHALLQSLNDKAREVATHPWLRQCSAAAQVAGAKMPEVIGVSPREHVGTCNICQRSTYERSALVSVYWAGRTLSREYVLR